MLPNSVRLPPPVGLTWQTMHLYPVRTARYGSASETAGPSAPPAGGRAVARATVEPLSGMRAGAVTAAQAGAPGAGRWGEGPEPPPAPEPESASGAGARSSAADAVPVLIGSALESGCVIAAPSRIHWRIT